EPLVFSLACRADQEVNNLGLRFEILGLDGTVIGTTFSDHTVSAKAGQTLTLTCALPTEHLAPAKLRAVATAYQSDRFGNQITVDRVEPALSFEVLPPDNASTLWLHKHWGQVKLDDTALTAITVSGPTEP
ncbi:MAG: hypothetical protein IKC50_03160, partial [Oscillospiraceae bacterium]|nr:hypothetical protein [Oscillospiraceae bacterium]